MKNLLLLILISLGIFGFSGKDKKGSKGKMAKWQSQMAEVGKSFKYLVPLVYSKKDFENSKNNKKVSENLEKFAKNIDKLSLGEAQDLLGNDPHVNRGVMNIKYLSQRASNAFRAGDFDTSRILIKNSIESCFKCHTRQSRGKKFSPWPDLDLAGLKVDPFDKSNIYVALRDYPRAKGVLSERLGQLERADSFGLEYDALIEKKLMVLLGAEYNLKEATGFLKGKLTKVGASERLRPNLKYWIQNLEELTKIKDSPKLLEGKIKSFLSSKKGVFSDRYLVANLVSVHFIHSQLAGEKSKVKKAEHYKDLGILYDELVGQGYWSLPEDYFEFCVRMAPKTKLSKQCFELFRDNIVLGYSGSRGVFVPYHEKERINQLKGIDGI